MHPVNRIFIVAAFVVAGAVYYSGVALAQETEASSSLEKCQKTAQKELAGYTADLRKQIANCLLKIAGEVIKDNPVAIDVSGATKQCISKFYKIGRSDGKSFAAKMEGKIAEDCNPADPGFDGVHSSDDFLGTGAPTVNQPLDVAVVLDGYCRDFATGAASFDEWLACARAGAECDARQQIALEFPRVLEWLNLMDTEFTASTSNKVADAQAALQAVEAAIDGGSDDDIPDIKCGPGLIPGIDPIVAATGLSTCWDASGAVVPCAGTGQDGEIQAGRAMAFLDNGDGTVTDLNTGLMWEKKSDDGSIHDKDTTYTFSEAASVHAAALNAEPFAGYNDWRVPNPKELSTICNYSRPNGRALPPELYQNCTPGCTVTTCSCAFSGFRWSSTLNQSLPTLGWTVSASNCDHSLATQTVSRGVRAVRGGL